MTDIPRTCSSCRHWWNVPPAMTGVCYRASRLERLLGLQVTDHHDGCDEHEIRTRDGGEEGD